MAATSTCVRLGCIELRARNGGQTIDLHRVEAPLSAGVGREANWFFPNPPLNRGAVQYNLNLTRSMTARPRFAECPLKFRTASSDQFIFKQTLIKDKFLPLRALNLSTMLDLGANVGVSYATVEGWGPSKFDSDERVRSFGTIEDRH
jgi:hypothetical protein